MSYDIIIGRDDAKKKELGTKGTVYLGKQYVKMGQATALSNNVFLDVSTSHVILVSGKRGTGKSTTLGVIAEGIAGLPKEIKENLSVLVLDTLGIFWSMKYPNIRQEDMLKQWEIKPEALDVKVYTPKGKYYEYQSRGIPTDFSFALKPEDLDVDDWCKLFSIDYLHPVGLLISRILASLKSPTFRDIIREIRNDLKSDEHIKDAAENLFKTAESWGIFDDYGNEIDDLIRGGQISILDLSCYTDWSIKTMVMGILGKKLLQQRMDVRKSEEMKMVSRANDYFGIEEQQKQMPLVWILLDEGHEFLPKDRITPATEALVQILREGRQPGITTVIATQQPGEISRDAITQSDVVISHRLTANIDITALSNIMQSYLSEDLTSMLNNLPQEKGSALILDDNSERVYPMRVRPKKSWHGGEAPSALEQSKKVLDLGI